MSTGLDRNSFFTTNELTIKEKMCKFISLHVIMCAVLLRLTDCTSSFDQRQTGAFNVQIGLKNIQLIALLKGGNEEYVDYDYAYDYSEMTIKPQNGTTPKPLNVTNVTTPSPAHLGVIDFTPDVNDTEVNINSTYVNMNATDVNINATGVNMNATEVNINATKPNMNATDVNINATGVNMNATEVNINVTKPNMNATEINTNATKPNMNATDVNINATEVNIYATGPNINAVGLIGNATVENMTSNINQTANMVVANVSVQSTTKKVPYGDEPTTISSDSTSMATVASNNDCRRGFVQNNQGKCEYKVHGTSNALRRIVKLAQKIKIGRGYKGT